MQEGNLAIENEIIESLVNARFQKYKQKIPKYLHKCALNISNEKNDNS